MTREELDRLTLRYLATSFEELEDDLALDWAPEALEAWSWQLNDRCYALSGSLSVGDVTATLPLVESVAPHATEQEKRKLARRFLEVQLKTSMAALKALSGEPLEAPVVPAASAAAPDAPIASPSISDVVNLYAEERISSGKWSPKTAGQNQKIYALISDLLINRMVGSITKADIRQLGLDIRRLPANMTKRHPGMTAREVLALELSEVSNPRLKPRSVNKH